MAFTLFFWRTTPAGIVGIAVLCVGDGLAEVVGRRYGKDKLPHNRNKVCSLRVCIMASACAERSRWLTGTECMCLLGVAEPSGVAGLPAGRLHCGTGLSVVLQKLRHLSLGVSACETWSMQRLLQPFVARLWSLSPMGNLTTSPCRLQRRRQHTLCSARSVERRTLHMSTVVEHHTHFFEFIERTLKGAIVPSF